MRRLAPVLLVAVAACTSDQGLDRPVPDFGPPNQIAIQTPTRTDRVMQLTIPRVDALFIVDNSCSMSEEQTLLATNFPSFLAWFQESGLDYHIGVVSTDMVDPLESGRLRVIGDRRWVDDRVADPEATFAAMSVMGTDGHWVEKGRAAAYTAVELLRVADNTGFVRPDAAMHMTVVSDENDESGDSPIGRDEFVEWLRGYRSGRRMVSFSSIVGPVAGCADIGSPGVEYSAVSSELNGVVWPICDPDWTTVLDELGFLAVGLQKEFFLSALPIYETIDVSVELQDGAVQVFDRRDWSYDPQRNSITFVNQTPDPLTTVVIHYQIESADQVGGDLGEPGRE